jgi:outer membrane protein assembly factor BamB
MTIRKTIRKVSNNHGCLRCSAFALWTGLSALVVSPAMADWPGLLGPGRDGFASKDARVSDHANKPPKLRWEIDAGQGYAGAAIEQDQVVMFFREGANDIVQAVSLDTGSTIWRTTYPAEYKQGIDSDTGPRCVPQIVQGRVFAYSASGALHCLSAAEGKKLWSRPLRKEYSADDGYFGAGSTPLVIGDLVIVHVGGRKNGGVVAVSVADGKTLWEATDADASYSSPILWNQQIVAATRLETYGLSPSDGKVLWKFPFGQRGPTVNAATPIVTQEGRLFLTASYGIGFVIAESSDEKIRVLHKGDAISSQYATPISVADCVYGSDGREDTGSSGFVCVDSKTGKTIWNQDGMPICHTIGIASEGQTHLLLVGIDGKLWYLPATRKGFQPQWTSLLPSGKYRALPALSKNLLVVRTSGGSNAKWRCFEL